MGGFKQPLIAHFDGSKWANDQGAVLPSQSNLRDVVGVSRSDAWASECETNSAFRDEQVAEPPVEHPVQLPAEMTAQLAEVAWMSPRVTSIATTPRLVDTRGLPFAPLR